MKGFRLSGSLRHESKPWQRRRRMQHRMSGAGCRQASGGSHPSARTKQESPTARTWGEGLGSGGEAEGGTAAVWRRQGFQAPTFKPVARNLNGRHAAASAFCRMLGGQARSQGSKRRWTCCCAACGLGCRPHECHARPRDTRLAIANFPPFGQPAQHGPCSLEVQNLLCLHRSARAACLHPIPGRLPHEQPQTASKIELCSARRAAGSSGGGLTP